MRRFHLFEFGDQPWLPQKFRKALTAYLAVAYRKTPFPALWADKLVPLLSPTGPNEIVDLGSGSGGPMLLVLRELSNRGFEVHATLTDLHANPGALNAKELWPPNLTYYPDPVDAANMQDFSGIRTMFALFHHFRPETARRILKNAFEQRRPICIFEGTPRAPGPVASTILIPLLVLIFTPLIRPVSMLQIFFTYVVPLLPLISFWDGLVSHLRTYSVEELTLMTSGLRSPDYIWEIGRIQVPRLPAALPYLIGRPTCERA